MIELVEYELTEHTRSQNEVRIGTVANLISDVPYGLCAYDVIPPHGVLNDVLNKGSAAGGMGPGLIWRPFAVNEAEYELVVDDLLRGHGTALTIDDNRDPPASYEDWVLAVAGDRLVTLPNGGVGIGPGTCGGPPPCAERRIAALQASPGRPPARYYRYTLLAPRGGRYPGRVGSLANFVCDVPGAWHLHGLAPAAILRDLTKRGRVDLGGERGGAVWHPFAPDGGEYELAVADLRRGNVGATHVSEPPLSVVDFDGWTDWRLSEIDRLMRIVRSGTVPTELTGSRPGTARPAS
jgi:hypothetical protein